MRIFEQIRSILQAYNENYIEPYGFDLGIWIIKVTNKNFNPYLADCLFNMASEYDPIGYFNGITIEGIKIFIKDLKEKNSIMEKKLNAIYMAIEEGRLSELKEILDE